MKKLMVNVLYSEYLVQVMNPPDKRLQRTEFGGWSRLFPILALLTISVLPYYGHAQEDTTYECILFVNDRGTPMPGVRVDVFGDDTSSIWAVSDENGIVAFGLWAGVSYEIYALERGYHPIDFIVKPSEWTEYSRKYDLAMEALPLSKHYYGLAIFDSCSVELSDDGFASGLHDAVVAYGKGVGLVAEVVFYYDSVPCHQELATERINVVMGILEHEGFPKKEVKLYWKAYKPVKITWMGSGFPLGTVLDDEYIEALEDPAMKARARHYNLRIEVHLYSF